MTLPDELVEAARSTARHQCVSFATSFFRCPKQSGGAVCDHLYLRLEPVFVALLIITDVDLGTTVAGIKGMMPLAKAPQNGTQ